MVPSGITATGARVLFVEDEASITEPFRLTLEREGFAPEVVRTVAAAIILLDAETGAEAT